MKMILNILIITSLFIGCTKEESQSQENSIYGTWKLVETYSSDGGSNSKWSKVSNGFTYKFNSDGTFTSNRFSECSTGKFEMSSNQLTLIFTCVGFDSGITDPPNTFVENIIFESSYLFISPTYMNCDEGCSLKFQKIE